MGRLCVWEVAVEVDRGLIEDHILTLGVNDKILF